MNLLLGTDYVIGHMRVQRRERVLLAQGEVQKIGGRAFDLLLALLDRRDRDVSKRELMDVVWPSLIVEENNLQVQVNALRKIFGPKAILNIPGRGYRFALSVEEIRPPAAAPAAPVATLARTNLPTALPPLYGRSEDTVALLALLSESPIVTIVGPGGIGKTRLAHAVGASLRGAFPDGVWLADLSPLTDPELVADTVVRVLEVAPSNRCGDVESSARAMAGLRILLILDNCEHVLEGIDRLVESIRRLAPSVKILATSQEPLKHAEERQFRVAPLSLPRAESVVEALEAGAVQLLLARVQAANPRFFVTEDNLKAVIDVCRRLDGLPLAIELAAARVVQFGIDNVRNRLDERFRLLTAGSRVSMRRQQTLRAALEWSYSLLTAREQVVFDRLGVFVGGFSLEVAQHAARDDKIDEWDVLDALGALVDKSLVLAEAGPEPRYRMLESNRAFALERLAAGGATEVMLQRHAEALLELFERFHSGQRRGMSLKTEVERLAPDLDNLRAALSWASRSPGASPIGVALIGASACENFWGYLGLYAERRHWCDVFRSRVDESMQPTEVARLWLASAGVGYGREQFEETLRDCDRALALLREIGEPIGCFEALTSRALTLTVAGRLEESFSALQEARSLEQSVWPPLVRQRLAQAEGLHNLHVGKFDEARHCFQEAIQRCNEGGDDNAAILNAAACVEAELMLGNAGGAADICRRLIDEARRARNEMAGGIAFQALGAAMLELGRIDDAEAAYVDALPPIQRAFGTAASLLDDMAYLLAQHGRIEDAARIAAHADRHYSAHGRKRRPSSERNRKRLICLLESCRAAEDLAVLYREGEGLSEAEACRIAFQFETQLTAGAE